MSQMHNIEIRPDDDQSWINWGKLVYKWATGEVAKPDTLEKLNKQWEKYDIKATFKGKPGRAVSVRIYDPNSDPENTALIISIPPQYMIDADHAFLLTRKKYPVPDFYTQIYKNDPARKVLTKEEMEDIGYARLGEYVINECM